MKKLPLFIIACLLVSFFSGCDEWKGSSKTEPQPKSKPEPQPQLQTHTRSPSVACSADGKTVYWISTAEQFNVIEMYKSEDGGKTWVKINLYIPGDPNDPYDESTYISVPKKDLQEKSYYYNNPEIEDPFEKAHEASKKKREAVPIPRNGK